jgi:hypothetical protein
MKCQQPAGDGNPEPPKIQYRGYKMRKSVKPVSLVAVLLSALLLVSLALPYRLYAAQPESPVLTISGSTINWSIPGGATPAYYLLHVNWVERLRLESYANSYDLLDLNLPANVTHNISVTAVYAIGSGTDFALADLRLVSNPVTFGGTVAIQLPAPQISLVGGYFLQISTFWPQVPDLLANRAEFIISVGGIERTRIGMTQGGGASFDLNVLGLPPGQYPVTVSAIIPGNEFYAPSPASNTAIFTTNNIINTLPTPYIYFNEPTIQVNIPPDGVPLEIYNAIRFRVYVNDNLVNQTFPGYFSIEQLNLTPGTHRILVVATVADAAWNDSRRSNDIRVTIPPPTYQPQIVAATGRISFGGRVYQVFDTGMSWDDARAYAQSLGGDLAVVRNIQTQQFLENLIREGRKENYWLGGYRISPIGVAQFRWVSGEAFAFTNWAEGEPNNLHPVVGGEDRIQISTNTGQWYDIPNRGIPTPGYTGFRLDTLGFIVEWPLGTTETNAPRITSVTINPAVVTVGETVDLQAIGIINVTRLQVIAHSQGSTQVVYSVSNLPPNYTMRVTLENALVDYLIVRAFGANNTREDRIIPVTVNPIPVTPPIIEPPHEEPPHQEESQIENRFDLAVTVPANGIGASLIWNHLPNNVFGYRVFRARNQEEHGDLVAFNPISAHTRFAVNHVMTFDPNALPGETYYYYVRAVTQISPEVLGHPSPRVQVTIPVQGPAHTPGRTRGFITMTIGNPEMNVNNAWQDIDPGFGTSPIISNDRTMVPIRAIVEGMEGTVAWDGADARIDMNLDGNHVQMWTGRREVMVNGNRLEMDVLPQIVNDRTLIPVRFVAEFLGAHIGWIEARQMVIISYDR